MLQLNLVTSLVVNIFFFFFIQKPQIFVSILLRIYRKYTDLIKQSFRQDAGFVASMDKVLYHIYIICSVNIYLFIIFY